VWRHTFTPHMPAFIAYSKTNLFSLDLTHKYYHCTISYLFDNAHSIRYTLNRTKIKFRDIPSHVYFGIIGFESLPCLYNSGSHSECKRFSYQNNFCYFSLFPRNFMRFVTYRPTYLIGRSQWSRRPRPVFFSRCNTGTVILNSTWRQRCLCMCVLSCVCRGFATDRSPFHEVLSVA
jgi:hypothetical protein